MTAFGQPVLLDAETRSNRSLSSADMLLLIIGDGIRSSLESLVAFFDRHAMLRYGLALIEVAVYQGAGTQLFVQPRVLAKAKLVERHVVFAGSHTPEPARTDIPAEGKELTASANWFTQFWKEFLAMLKLDDGKQPLPNLPKAANLFLPMPPGGSSAWISTYLSKSKSEAGVYLCFSKLYEDAPGTYEALLAERAEIDASLGAPVEWTNPTEHGHSVWFHMKIGDLDASAERERVQRTLARMTNLFVTAFRQRLARITAEGE